MVKGIDFHGSGFVFSLLNNSKKLFWQREQMKTNWRHNHVWHVYIKYFHVKWKPVGLSVFDFSWNTVWVQHHRLMVWRHAISFDRWKLFQYCSIMFKKLKDKIAEEVKQSPLRLPTSVQQHLSQVMILNRFLRLRYNKIFAAIAYWWPRSTFLLLKYCGLYRASRLSGWGHGKTSF